MNEQTFSKADLLSNPVEHVDITSFDARPIIDAYDKTAFQARNLARAAQTFDSMLADTECSVILTLAGSLISAGMKEAMITLVERGMVDAIVSSGANIVDQDFFEGLGFRHYIAPGSPECPVVDDPTLRELAIDRIYDTYIDEDELRVCDETMHRIFNDLEPRPHSSREIVAAMGDYLQEHHPQARSLVLAARKAGVPIFVPALSDCSAGFGIVLHQAEREGRPMCSIDSGRDFLELTRIKLMAGDTGILMLGGGVPKNFTQDIVVAAELLGHEVSMHKYAIQITVADARDGALSGSTLREASSWGKVEVTDEQMVFGEVTTLFPLLASDAFHRGSWKARSARRFNDRLAAEAPAAAT
jgi:deoxyhypusine synthase